ncbi:MAG: recombinase family protein, partial [Flavobacteriales bacterium]
ERNGWTVIKEYVDFGISGAKGREQRPEFDACLKSAIRKEVDVVMFWSIDRASRSLQHLVEMMNELQSKNIDLYFHQQAVDTTTPAGRALFQM